MAPPVAATTMVATIPGFSGTSTVTTAIASTATTTTNKSRRKSTVSLAGITTKGSGGATGMNGSACTVNEDTLKLIECVKSRPALWHRKHLRQRVQVAHHGWEEIRKAFKATEVTSLKVRWKTLRDSFRREVKRIEDGEIKTSSWPLFERMSFLIGHFRTRESYFKSGSISPDLLRNGSSQSNAEVSDDGHKIMDSHQEPSLMVAAAALAHTNNSNNASDIQVVEALTIYPVIRNEAYETVQESATVASEQHAIDADPDEITMAETYESLQPEVEEIVEDDDDVILEQVPSQDEIIEIPSQVFGEVTFKNKLRARIKTEPLDGDRKEVLSMFGQRMLEPDSDYNFLMSLHPFLKRLPGKKNLAVRIKIQQLIAEVIEEED